MSCDSCLSGCGGWSSSECFQCEFPQFIKTMALHINELELLTIVVALKLWVKHFNRQKLNIFCDNTTTVAVINLGKAKNTFAQKCLREIAYICSLNNCQIKMVHLSGTSNRLADELSRMHLNDTHKRKALKLMIKNNLKMVVVNTNLFRFESDW